MLTLRDDRILDLGSGKSQVADHDLGDAILFPQFINAHTHLEFSELQRPLGNPQMEFAQWLMEVIAWRRSRSQGIPPDELCRFKRRAIAAGLAESSAAAVAAVGEIGSAPCRADDYADSAAACVVFHERLGLATESLDGTQAELEQDLVGFAPAFQPLDLERVDRPDPCARSRRLRAGISPHAPYSTHFELVRRLVDCARERGLPVAMHLAESRSELELLEERHGPLRRLLEALDVWRADAFPAGASIRAYLGLLAAAPRSLIIHGNYLTESDLDFVARHRERMSIVYCPRTHAYFGHEPYPLREMLQRRIPVALGTDSRASNPDLSIAAEVCFAAARFPQVESAAWLRMVTADAARALGVEREWGTLTIGKRAALASVVIPSAATEDVHHLWLACLENCRPVA
jgi:cytosine/adenosine deaminase-related metal-dependent hydrolase